MQSSYFRMYIYLFVAFYGTSGFYSCKSDEASDINGYSKVISIELPNKMSIAVDSQFYAFQKKYVFSFTRLIDPSNAAISYGYIKYHISMSKRASPLP
jgi:hypothetical protein